ncbi:cytochrome P450 family protein [Cercophora newfieldiana]|uniref:Cytochrome P450 family protein n=1 Tax=Cercophora newfieldiana TaxID=92897 RepID=A0AA39YAW1_9PEZI|nr:cytochrome P450 family protein [Cercophora newfieldiana]
MALLIPILAAACIAAYTLYFLANRFVAWKRLRHISGPAEAAWSQSWLVRHQLGGDMCFDLEAVCNKYGPLARVGPNFLVCSEPSEIRRVWSVHSGYQRADWYKGYRIDPSSDSVLTAIENKEHHRLRTQLLPGYMGRGQGGQEKLLDEQVLKFIKLVERAYLSDNVATREMDMGDVFVYLTQDITSAIEFGEPFGYLDSNADTNGIIKALDSMKLPCAVLALLPSVTAVAQSTVFTPFLPKPTDPTGVGRMLGIVKAHVDKRYGEKKQKRTDVLQSFVDSGLSQKEVEAEALVHLLGGSDTTATALRIAVFHISSNPRAYRRLQAEIDSAASSVTRPIIADAEAKKLPYLQATIKEALRMWPPISGLMPKVSARDDVICGKAVPAGTMVGWCAFGAMKNKGVFGENADDFEPARWLEAEPEKLKEMEATQALVFVAGTRWECLGKKLAYSELGKVLFEFFLRFDVSMINPAKPFSWSNQGFTTHQNMKAKVTKRDVAGSN